MNSNEILLEIKDNILKKLDEHSRDHVENAKVIIYMDSEFFQKLSAGLIKEGFNPSSSFDFVDHYSIMGYPVFRVIPQYTREGTIKHSDYEIVIL